VLDGDPVPPQKAGTAANFQPMSIVGVCVRIRHGTEVGLSLGDIVLDGDPAPRERGTCLSPISAIAELLFYLYTVGKLSISYILSFSYAVFYLRHCARAHVLLTTPCLKKRSTCGLL